MCNYGKQLACCGCPNKDQTGIFHVCQWSSWSLAKPPPVFSYRAQSSPGRWDKAPRASNSCVQLGPTSICGNNHENVLCGLFGRPLSSAARCEDSCSLNPQLLWHLVFDIFTLLLGKLSSLLCVWLENTFALCLLLNTQVGISFSAHHDIPLNLPSYVLKGLVCFIKRDLISHK